MSFELQYVDYPAQGGPFCYAYIPWDSELFDTQFYELRFSDRCADVDRLLPLWQASFPAAGCGFACAKLSPDRVELTANLSKHGFYPVETMIETSRNLSDFKPVYPVDRPDLELRRGQEEDMPELMRIAACAFFRDRFHLDSSLSSDKADRRYAKWVENGFCAGEDFLVFEDVRKGTTLGFFHLREAAESIVDISLAALDPKYQGLGLGAQMYQALVLEYRRLGYKRIQTRISINNTAVLNLYAHLGFTFRNPLLTLHCSLPKRQSIG